MAKFALIILIVVLFAVAVGLITGFFIIRQRVLSLEDNPSAYCATVVCPGGEVFAEPQLPTEDS